MADQFLSTRLQLDAVLGGSYKKSFLSAESHLKELKMDSRALGKEFDALGKQADDLDKIGESSADIRQEMARLENQIKQTTRATEQFKASRHHFRNASIGARALGSDVAKLGRLARNTGLALIGMTGAAAAALKPSEEVLDFESRLGASARSQIGVDASQVDQARDAILRLSSEYGIATSEIAQRHQQLSRFMSFEDANQVIRSAVQLSRSPAPLSPI